MEAWASNGAALASLSSMADWQGSRHHASPEKNKLELFGKRLLTASFIAGLGLSLFQIAWAGSSVGASGGKTTPYGSANTASSQSAPFEDERYRPCGNDCLQKKARENLSFDSLYTINLLNRLDQKVKGGTDPEMQEVRAVIYRFCLSSEHDSAGIKKCYKRFRRAQLLGLRRKRAAIIQSGSNVEKLRSDATTVASISKEEYEQLIPQHTQPVGLKPIEDAMAQGDVLNKQIVSEGYQRWVDGIPKKPEPTDFVKFTEIDMNEGDSENPEPRVVVKMTIGPDGKEVPEIDKDAFQQALQEYQTAYQAYVSRARGQGTPAKAGEPTLDDYEKLLEHGSPLYSLQTGQPSNLSTMEKEAFTEARKQLVSVASGAAQAGSNAPSNGLAAYFNETPAPVEEKFTDSTAQSATKTPARNIAKTGSDIEFAPQAQVQDPGEAQVLTPLPGSASRDVFIQFEPGALGDHIDTFEKTEKDL